MPASRAEASAGVDGAGPEASETAAPGAPASLTMSACVAGSKIGAALNVQPATAPSASTQTSSGCSALCRSTEKHVPVAQLFGSVSSSPVVVRQRPALRIALADAFSFQLLERVGVLA